MRFDAPVAFALEITLVLIALERAFELMLSARHQREIVARGGVEFGREHFAGFVLLHTLYPLAMAVEVAWGGARPWAWWPAAAAVVVVAHGLRLLAMRALGERWHTRVWVVPGETPIRRGIYRWLRHPNYVGVALEIAALPLAFGAWRTAILASLFNAVLLAIRIRVEERALRWAAEQPPFGAVPESPAPEGAAL